MDDAARLDTAIRAAREGGRVAREHLGDPLYFKVKDRRDLLVGASVIVQDTIRDMLLGEYPDDGFLGEEGPDDEVLPVNAERLWIVDPIDGSTNYFQGVPHFGISIGYRDAYGFRVGVVYDPSRDELFTARLGDGARLNGVRINVHIPGEGEDAYERSLIGTDLPGSTEGRVEGLRAATHVANRMLDLVMMGSPALGTTAAGCVCTPGRVATAIPPATTAPTATPAPAPAMNSRLVTTGRHCSDPSSGVPSAGSGSSLSAMLFSWRLLAGWRTP